MDKLAQMHLLLREYGWEPDDGSFAWHAGPDKYWWRHSAQYKDEFDDVVEFLTSRSKGWQQVWVCAIGTEDETRGYPSRPNRSVGGLRRLLKELAK